MKNLLSAALLLLVSANSAFAWTAAGDRKIANKSAQLAPPDLKLLIDTFPEAYAAGLESARGSEGTPSHRLARGGQLRTALTNEIRGSIAMVRKRGSMYEFVQRLGVISHLVADANNPLHVVSDQELEPSHEDYERFFESRIAKFPTVFYGLERDFRLESYLETMFGRSVRWAPLLREEYFRFGERRRASEFDDRSTGFGIASLAYSHSVTDLVNIYYYIWKEVGGDVRTAAAMQKGNLLLNRQDGR